MEPGGRRARPLHLPIYGARARGGDDRRGHGRRRRLVHGAPPPDVRGSHALHHGVHRRVRGKPRGRPRRHRLLRRVRRGRARARCSGGDAPRHRLGVGGDRLRTGARSRARLPLRQPVPRHPQRARLAPLRNVPRDHELAGHRAARRRDRRDRGRRRRRTAAALRLHRPRRRTRTRRPGAASRPRLPPRARAVGGGDEPDHGRTARLLAARRARRCRAADHEPPAARHRAVRRARTRRHLDRARARVLLDLSRRLLHHVARVHCVRARARVLA